MSLPYISQALPLSFGSLPLSKETETKEFLEKPLALSQKEAFVKELSLEQIKIKDSIIHKAYTLEPNPYPSCDLSPKIMGCSVLPSLSFSAFDIAFFLMTELIENRIISGDPFLIGGAASHVLSDPEKALSFSDVDLCFYINVPAYDEIKNLLVEFIVEQLKKKGRDSLVSYQFLQLPARLRDQFITENYLYRKAFLTGIDGRKGGAFFGLGKIEIKFFCGDICRQNVSLSDGFRIAILQNLVSCVNGTNWCNARQFEQALDAQKTRQFIVDQPEEVSDLIFRCSHKLTQGFEIKQFKIMEVAWKQLKNSYFAETSEKWKLEAVGEKLHQQQLNHYHNNRFEKFFDFVHLLTIVIQVESDSVSSLYCQAIASAWLLNASKKEKGGFLGEFALLIQQNPAKINQLLSLFQGILFYLWTQNDEHVCYLGFLDLTSTCSIIAFSRHEKVQYLTLTCSPPKLAENFLMSWLDIEKSSSEMHFLINNIWKGLGLHSVEFNPKTCLIVAQNLFDSLENKHITSVLPATMSFQTLYEFLLINMSEIGPKDVIEKRLLQIHLQSQLREARALKNKSHEEILLVVTKYLFQSCLTDIKPLLLILKSTINEEIHSSFRKILTHSCWIIFQKILSNPSALFIKNAHELYFLLNQLKLIETLEQEKGLQLLLSSYESLMETKNSENLTLIYHSFSSLKKWKERPKNVEKFFEELLYRLLKLMLQEAQILTSKLSSTTPDTPEGHRPYHFLFAILTSNELRSFDLKTIETIFSSLLNHAIENSTGGFLWSAGMITEKFFEKMKSTEYLTNTVIKLFYKLLFIKSKQVQDKKISDYKIFGIKIASILANHYPDQFQSEILLKATNILFTFASKDFLRTIKKRRHRYQRIIQALHSIVKTLQWDETQIALIHEMTTMDLERKHTLICKKFLQAVFSMNTHLVQKIFSKVPPEILTKKDIAKTVLPFVQKLILLKNQTTLKQALELLLPMKSLGCITQKVLGLADILNAYICLKDKSNELEITIALNAFFSYLHENPLIFEILQKEGITKNISTNIILHISTTGRLVLDILQSNKSHMIWLAEQDHYFCLLFFREIAESKDQDFFPLIESSSFRQLFLIEVRTLQAMYICKYIANLCTLESSREKILVYSAFAEKIWYQFLESQKKDSSNRIIAVKHLILIFSKTANFQNILKSCDLFYDCALQDSALSFLQLLTGLFHLPECEKHALIPIFEKILKFLHANNLLRLNTEESSRLFYILKSHFKDDKTSLIFTYNVLGSLLNNEIIIDVYEKKESKDRKKRNLIGQIQQKDLYNLITEMCHAFSKNDLQKPFEYLCKLSKTYFSDKQLAAFNEKIQKYEFAQPRISIEIKDKVFQNICYHLSKKFLILFIFSIFASIVLENAKNNNKSI